MKVWNSGTKKDENNIWKYLIPDFYSNRLFAALFDFGNIINQVIKFLLKF